jgi:hypothetical protein
VHKTSQGREWNADIVTPTPNRVGWGEGLTKPDTTKGVTEVAPEGTTPKAEAEATFEAEAEATSEDDAEGTSESGEEPPASPPATKPKAGKPRYKDTARMAMPYSDSE